jgi:hypothetical protein
MTFKEDIVTSLQSLSILLLGLGAALAQAATPAPPSGLTPVDMRGLWFEKSEAGAAKCAAYLGKKPVEPDPGALVIHERQLLRWADNSQNTMYFVTDVQPRRANTWRLQALVDAPPYEAPKVLETYVFELRQDELLWSKRRAEDAMTEQVDTAVFARCGY